jgi:hypothetical protein
VSIELADDLFGGPARPLEKLKDAEARFSADRARQARAKRGPSEKQVEADHMAAVKADGGISYKFTSPARRAVPDRLDLRPIPPEHREIVARYVRFTECKRPGEKPTPAQQREHDYLRSLGFQVDVIDQRKSK